MYDHTYDYRLDWLCGYMITDWMYDYFFRDRLDWLCGYIITDWIDSSEIDV